MATYAELLTAYSHPGLRNQVRVAVVIAAEAVRTEAGATSNHANRLIWAKGVYANPDAESVRMMWAVLAQNAAATYIAITTATDASVQTAVNNAIDVFAS